MAPVPMGMGCVSPSLLCPLQRSCPGLGASDGAEGPPVMGTPVQTQGHVAGALSRQPGRGR